MRAGGETSGNLISDKLLLVGSGLFGQVLRIVTFLVMGRLIANEAFGVWDLMLATTGMLGFGDLLLPRSMVSVRDRPEKEVIATTMGLGILLYCFYALVTLCAGAWLAWKYDKIAFFHIAAMWASSQVITMAYNLQLSLLNRRMQFKHEALASTVSSTCGSLSAIGMAFGGFQVYALAGQSLVAGAIGLSITCWMLGPPRIQGATFGAVKYLTKQGIKASVTVYAMNLQNGGVRWIIETIGGLHAVGIWGRVIGVNQLFAQNIIATLERVSFTMMCGATGDPKRFREVMHESVCIQLAITAFTGAWMFAGCENLVLATIGPSWMDVPPLLKWLAMTVPIAAISNTGYLALFAMGRMWTLASVAVVEMVVSLTLVFLVRHQGMEAIAIAWSVSRVIVGMGMYIVACRVCGGGARKVLGTTAILLAMAAVAGFVMVLLQPRLESQILLLITANVPTFLKNVLVNGGALGFASVAAVCIYGSLLVLLQPKLFARIRQLSLRKRG